MFIIPSVAGPRQLHSTLLQLLRSRTGTMAGVLVINGITSSDNLKTQSDSLYQDVEKSYDNWR